MMALPYSTQAINIYCVLYHRREETGNIIWIAVFESIVFFRRKKYIWPVFKYFSDYDCTKLIRIVARIPSLETINALRPLYY